MTYIFVNLKRFDIPKSLGGINSDNRIDDFGINIVKRTDEGILKYKNTEFCTFFPEAHILNAVKAKALYSRMKIGCQSLHWNDVEIGGNFGAFTSSRTAKSMLALGCEWTIIGHCEERRDLQHILGAAGCISSQAVSGILSQKVRAAVKAGLNVLFCIGETSDEQIDKYNILTAQIMMGLQDVDLDKIVIAYEPVWAIGPGKTAPDSAYIEDIAQHIKSIISVPVVYGGGLKKDNAAMLGAIENIDGGLIALTRFEGDIGFYPEEYLEITNLYLSVKEGTQE